jgi:predicted nucleic acid-binding protein
MMIVDSSIWIDLLAGRRTPHTAFLGRNIQSNQVGLTDLILYELLQGARSDAQAEEVFDRMTEFVVWPTISPGLEVKAAQNYRSLRQRGVTVRKTVDCLIATFCIESGHTILHNDRDFNGFERYLGLKVVRMDVP